MSFTGQLLKRIEEEKRGSAFACKDTRSVDRQGTQGFTVNLLTGFYHWIFSLLTLKLFFTVYIQMRSVDKPLFEDPNHTFKPSTQT